MPKGRKTGIIKSKSSAKRAPAKSKIVTKKTPNKRIVARKKK